MSQMKQRSHRTWEDWLGVVLGIAIVFAPWLNNETNDSRMLVNSTLAGTAVLMLAEFDLVRFRRWPEIGLLLLGLWVAVAPFVLGYGGATRMMHVVCGLAVAVLAAMALREGSTT